MFSLYNFLLSSENTTNPPISSLSEIQAHRLLQPVAYTRPRGMFVVARGTIFAHRRHRPTDYMHVPISLGYLNAFPPKCV